ncbi:MAG: hypothetical protein M3P85_09295 [Actinomycetota bacterium]|nr:hypothetical protein [Actinomycetota bacterium]
MTTATESPRPDHAQAGGRTSRRGGLTRTAVGVLGLMTVADGIALMVLAFAGDPGEAIRLAELGFGAAVLVPGMLLVKLGFSRGAVRLGLLLPELVLAAALLTLGVAMPAFHRGAVGYETARNQFLLVVLALALGSAGLVLSGLSAPTAERGGRLSFPGALRDGVLLIVGTILLAIGIGQLAGPKLMPPMWNWISFLGITIPGMLVLIAREFVKQADRRRDHRGPGALGRSLLIELMLVGGLFVMIYGSAANLTLGKNGFTTGFKNDTAGLTLLLAAIIVLVLVRGAAKRAVPQRSTALLVMLGHLLYAAAVIAFIYGERSVIMGKPPMIQIGAAAGAASAILVTGVLVLVIGRTLASPRVSNLGIAAPTEAAAR